MKSIGGHFGLELRQGNPYYTDALAMNYGRCAFEYALRAGGFTKVYIPRYICPDMTDVINNRLYQTITREFYSVDNNFIPLFDYSRIQPDEAFLYVNYFGLQNNTVRTLANALIKGTWIIDNTQAFFAEPVAGAITIYSCRKWFGVPDGAYLYIDNLWSKHHTIHQQPSLLFHLNALLKRMVDDPAAWGEFKAAEMSIGNYPMQWMSEQTKVLLESIDYNFVSTRRRNNYNDLWSALHDTNQVHNVPYLREGDAVPFCFPYWCEKSGLREWLISKNIFVPQYWPGILWLGVGDTEWNFVQHICPLPIDQRYDSSDMECIVEAIGY